MNKLDIALNVKKMVESIGKAEMMQKAYLDTSNHCRDELFGYSKKYTDDEKRELKSEYIAYREFAFEKEGEIKLMKKQLDLFLEDLKESFLQDLKKERI